MITDTVPISDPSQFKHSLPLPVPQPGHAAVIPASGRSTGASCSPRPGPAPCPPSVAPFGARLLMSQRWSLQQVLGTVPCGMAEPTLEVSQPEAAPLGLLLCQEPRYWQSPCLAALVAITLQQLNRSPALPNQEIIEVESITNRSRSPVLTMNNCCINCPSPCWLVLVSMTPVTATAQQQ